MKILIIKLGAIGDVIQLCAAVKYYRTIYPSHGIDWMTSIELVKLIESMGVADTVFGIDSNIISSKSLLKRLLWLIKINIIFSRQYIRYEYLVFPYMDWRYKLIATIVFWKKFKYFNMNEERMPVSHRHRVYEYWRLLSGEENRNFDISRAMNDLGKIFFKNSAPTDDLVNSLNAIKNSYVVLIPGGAKNQFRSDGLRRWPLTYYVTLADFMIKQGFNVVIAGGPTDSWVSYAFEKLSCTNLIGATNLHDMIHLLGRSLVVISHDTGPLHMAAMTRAPLVALFGPTPANAIIPKSRPNTIVLQLDNLISCSPCYDGKNYARCNKALCMDLISPQSVATSALALIESNFNSANISIP